MNGAALQALIYKQGYAMAAANLGASYQFYRMPSPIPAPGTGPWDSSGQTWDSGQIWDPVGWDTSGVDWDSGFHWDIPGNLTVTLNVSLNAEDMNYRKPQKYGKALWYALFDGTQAQVFDYFNGPQGTFFIAAMQPLLPILAVECNRVITVYRPETQSGIGEVAYGGTTVSNRKTIMKGWPCSILQGTKGEKNETGLPGDARSPWWIILLPDAGVQILPNDLITDDQGLQYVVSSPERTSLGYRITAMMAIA